MSSGRYAMRSRVFQSRAFAPWALAGAEAQVDLGSAVIGWSIGRSDRVFEVTANSRVWLTGRASRVFEIPEKKS